MLLLWRVKPLPLHLPNMHAENLITSPHLPALTSTHRVSHELRSHPNTYISIGPLYRIFLSHPTQSEEASHAPYHRRTRLLPTRGNLFVEGNQTIDGASSVSEPKARSHETIPPIPKDAQRITARPGSGVSPLCKNCCRPFSSMDRELWGWWSEETFGMCELFHLEW